jgi:hypothetical protein
MVLGSVDTVSAPVRILLGSITMIISCCLSFTTDHSQGSEYENGGPYLVKLNYESSEDAYRSILESIEQSIEDLYRMCADPNTQSRNWLSEHCIILGMMRALNVVGNSVDVDRELNRSLSRAQAEYWNNRK